MMFWTDTQGVSVAIKFEAKFAKTVFKNPYFTEYFKYD